MCILVHYNKVNTILTTKQIKKHNFVSQPIISP